jgi:NAD(P)H-nitrite reductase large subunit
MSKIVVLGNGISGVTAARHIRKMSNNEITIISSESKYFFSRTALMYVFMGHMRFKDTQPYEPGFWEKNRINLVQAHVNQIDFNKKYLHLNNEEKIEYDKLIIAVGSKPNKLGWKGENLKGVQGLYAKQDLELMEENTKNITKAVVVGGGLIGVEMAEMLLSRGIQVTFLVREKHFWGVVLPEADGAIVGREMLKHDGLEVIYDTELKEIIGDEKGRVKSIKTNSGSIIDCQFVGITVGVSPNVDFLNESDLNIKRGIVVNEYLETNMPDVYAIGDCAELNDPIGNRKNIEQVWYTGRIMGECVAETICGQKSAYNPGNWFNSAKFFDLEYQTYGWVWNELKSNEAEFIWEDNKKEKLVHFVFDKNTNQFLGLNTFGVRMRHEVIDNWLTHKKSIDYVIAHLSFANFDPEFYKQYEKDIVSQYNRKFQKSLSPAKKGWWRNALKFN